MRFLHIISSLCLSAFMAVSTAIAADFEIGQKDKTFVMDGNQVEEFSVKVGDTIHFKNQDPWFHNIFSLSDIKTFDLGSYPQGQSRSVTFETAGEAEIECAIHPQMYLLLKVE